MWYGNGMKSMESTDYEPCGRRLDGVCHKASGGVVSILTWGLTGRSIKAQGYICMSYISDYKSDSDAFRFWNGSRGLFTTCEFPSTIPNYISITIYIYIYMYMQKDWGAPDSNRWPPEFSWFTLRTFV